MAAQKTVAKQFHPCYFPNKWGFWGSILLNSGEGTQRLLSWPTDDGRWNRTMLEWRLWWSGWMQTALDRETWHSLGLAFVQHWRSYRSPWMTSRSAEWIPNLFLILWHHYLYYFITSYEPAITSAFGITEHYGWTFIFESSEL